MARLGGRFVALLLVAALALVGLSALRVARWHPLPLVGEEPTDGYPRASGVVHVHTTLSDGGGTPKETIRAARATGLTFLALTDHNHLDAKPLEGYREGVLVLVGSELSTTSGHVLGLGLREDPAFRFSGDARDVFEDVRDLGGFSFAAHPTSGRPDLAWTGWELAGPWGIELINGDTEFRRAGPRLLLTVGLYRLNPAWALLRTLRSPDEILRRWDEMLARRDVVGITGADAHGRVPITKTRALRFPSYQALLSLARNHLLLERPLTGDAAADSQTVLSALRRGRSYIGLDALAPADGFTFTVEGGGGRWTMGESVPVVRGLRARIGGRVPKGARIVLRRDGHVLAEATERLEIGLPGKAVYRVEVRVPGWPIPWVITNPVYVFTPFDLDARSGAAAFAGPPPPAREVHRLETLPGTWEFKAEADPSSWVDPKVLDPQGAPEGGPAQRLAFRLGAPGPGRPFTWCALVNRQERGISGHAGMSFRLRADGVYRIWVQVRDRNPASADGGEEWWLASVRTSPQWREVRLPFDRFRTINKRTDGRLDLDKVQALVFVLDHAADKPGTQGTIWLSDLALYY